MKKPKKSMKSNDELNDQDNLSTTPKGKGEQRLRRLSTQKDGGNKDAKLKSVPKAKHGVDEEGAPASDFVKMRKILTQQGAIKKRGKGRPQKKARY